MTVAYSLAASAPTCERSAPATCAIRTLQRSHRHRPTRHSVCERSDHAHASASLTPTQAEADTDRVALLTLRRLFFIEVEDMQTVQGNMLQSLRTVQAFLEENAAKLTDVVNTG